MSGIVRFYLRLGRARGPALHDADPHRSRRSRRCRSATRRSTRSISPRSSGPYATLGPRRGHLGAERARDRRAGVPRPGAAPSATSASACSSTRSSSAKKGLVTTVFDTTDRVQHMFYRYLDPTPPGEPRQGHDAPRATPSSEVYAAHGRPPRPRSLTRRGRPGHRLHGHVRPRLHQLPPRREPERLAARARLPVLKDGADDVRRLVRGRRLEPHAGLQPRAHGPVHQPQGPRGVRASSSEGAEYHALKAELIAGARGAGRPGDRPALHPQGRARRPTSSTARTATTRPTCWSATRAATATRGTARPAPSRAEVFSDNTKSWSGDHCVDPRIVPGVFFCNRRIDDRAPHILDLAAVACIRLFGQEPPRRQMQGRIARSRAPATPARDRARAARPGVPRRSRAAAPGARVHVPERASAA